MNDVLLGPCRIVHDWPRNIAEIEEAFPFVANGYGVIFSWAPNVIYNPHKVDIDWALIAHERVHHRQQGDDPERWWSRYITEPDFRLAQEVEAHQAEWRAVLDAGKSPRVRRERLGMIVKRLSGPLYGSMVTPTMAMQLVLG